MIVRRTLGATEQTVQTAVQAGGIAATAATPLLVTAATAAWAIPIVGAAFAGVALLINALWNREGPRLDGQATAILEPVEAAMKANLEAWKASKHTAANRAAALAYFDSAWAFLLSSQGCGSPNLKDSGRRCISERQRGGIRDFFAYYRDEIDKTPTVPDDPINALVSGDIQEAFRAILPSNPQEAAPLLIGAALILAGLLA